MSIGAKHELVFHAAANRLAAVNPTSGAALWQCRTKIEKYVNPARLHTVESFTRSAIRRGRPSRCEPAGGAR